MSNNKGFTLIELLIVIGIIGLLAGAVLVAVDPVKRIQDARNAKRWSEVNGILNAILTKQVDDKAYYNGESSAPVITQAGTNVQVIVTSDTGIVCNAAATRPGCNKPMDIAAANKNCVANLSALAPGFIAELPIEPRGAGTGFCITGSTCTTVGDLNFGPTNTGYYVAKNSAGRIEIGACAAEQGATISVKR
jgi:prepilin-type N-terminal cleavage/methylation domain-containing protein